MEAEVRRDSFKTFWDKYSDKADTNTMMLNHTANDLDASDRENILSSLPVLTNKDVVDIGAGIGSTRTTTACLGDNLRRTLAMPSSGLQGNTMAKSATLRKKERAGAGTTGEGRPSKLKYPTLLKNAQIFLERSRNASSINAYATESFDVTALYTNVSNDSAMQAIFELLIEHEGRIGMHGLSIHQLMVLLKECLNCSVFRCSEEYLEQIRVLAMGQRLAPSLAIVFMSKIEASVLDLRPLIYCRYVDDTLYFHVISVRLVST
ncbi:unnamed protein product [Angiostrongylus costaricensis]|uniref:Reverse transcriptase domain-containing protein n=1 Tax=Angiostrongylus costaricensis TaxID=334426 RepID=A0A0R3PZZ8_ANGCS|nr:unnamed protein product [Angiostrongylus costaricensis]